MSSPSRTADTRRGWGSDETGCTILHVDMDAFYASVELARRPELTGHPVIVGGAGRSVVVAASYEARTYGVRSAMPMAEARRRCPDAVIVRPDHHRYLQVSRSVMDMVGEVSPLVEQVSIDEAFIDVAGALRRLGTALEIAAGLRARIWAEHGITCSVGVAGTKSVAKLASTQAKPNGVLLVPREATRAFLRALPVEALWGVGQRTQAILAQWGILTVAQLADTDVAIVQAAVGRVVGAHLHELAWGRDPRPVNPRRTERSFGAETTFGADQRDRVVINEQVRQLADRCAVRLRRHGMLARTVSIKVRTSDFRTVGRSLTLETPTDAGHEIFVIARDLIASVDCRGLPVRLVGVRAERLIERAGAVLQPTFDDAESQRREARRSVEQVVDQLRERFGERIVGLGTPPERSATVHDEVDLSWEGQ